jgi:hypothetical protein
MKLAKIVMLSGLSLVTLVAGIAFLVAKNEDSALTQRLQEVLKQNNLAMESLSCHKELDAPLGFCSFKATPTQIQKLVAQLKLRFISISEQLSATDVEGGIEYYVPINTQLRQLCLANLNSSGTKINEYVYRGGTGRPALPYFSQFQLYYVKSTGTGCLGLKYRIESG